MKTTRTILIALTFSYSIIFASDAVILAKKAEIADQSIKKGTINLNVESNESSILGVQFDIIYNPQELYLSDSGISSKIPDMFLKSRVQEPGYAKVVMFSMNGDKILDINNGTIADIMEIKFEPVNMFNGTSKVELDDIILAGEGGIQVSSAPRTVLDVSYFTPQQTSLSKNYPNPFNPSTTIDYQLSKAGTVSLVVYDLKGSEVKTLVQEHQDATYYTVVWNGLNDNGQSVASGRYLLQMTAPGYSETITMTLLK